MGLLLSISWSGLFGSRYGEVSGTLTGQAT